ncbi:MAG: DUF503 domain-containing protein [Deltaproteobacteria bacterium]|nr:DUF503 domain-containing protein [Deltaproteobacteria bacterium]MBF0509060.1 DUF503 domain-containing protein [Deltaproteobacteria bacterium]
MFVGVARVALLIPGNSSLKGKRKVIKSLLDRLRSRFNVSAAEVGDNDLWQRALIGVSLVANDRRFVDAALSKVVEFIEFSGTAQVVDIYTEIINV